MLLPSVLFILVTMAVAYVVLVLTFDIDAIEPFTRDDISVFDGLGPEIRVGVSAFDHVRKFFGAYRVETRMQRTFWDVYEPRMALWRCPKCLSFWLSLPASIPYTLWLIDYTDDLRTLVFFIPLHLSMSLISTAINFNIYGRDTDGMFQMQEEESVHCSGDDEPVPDKN